MSIYTSTQLKWYLSVIFMWWVGEWWCLSFQSPTVLCLSYSLSFPLLSEFLWTHPDRKAYTLIPKLWLEQMWVPEATTLEYGKSYLKVKQKCVKWSPSWFFTNVWKKKLLLLCVFWKGKEKENGRKNKERKENCMFFLMLATF